MEIKLDSRGALYCPEYIHKQFAPACFPDIKFEEPKGIAGALSDAGHRFEAEVMARLEALAEQGKIRLVRIRGVDDAQAQLRGH